MQWQDIENSKKTGAAKPPLKSYAPRSKYQPPLHSSSSNSTTSSTAVPSSVLQNGKAISDNIYWSNPRTIEPHVSFASELNSPARVQSPQRLKNQAEDEEQLLRLSPHSRRSVDIVHQIEELMKEPHRTSHPAAVVSSPSFRPSPSQLKRESLNLAAASLEPHAMTTKKALDFSPDLGPSYSTARKSMTSTATTASASNQLNYSQSNMSIQTKQSKSTSRSSSPLSTSLSTSIIRGEATVDDLREDERLKIVDLVNQLEREKRIAMKVKQEKRESDRELDELRELNDQMMLERACILHHSSFAFSSHSLTSSTSKKV